MVGGPGFLRQPVVHAILAHYGRASQGKPAAAEPREEKKEGPRKTLDETSLQGEVPQPLQPITLSAVFESALAGSPSLHPDPEGGKLALPAAAKSQAPPVAKSSSSGTALATHKWSIDDQKVLKIVDKLVLALAPKAALIRAKSGASPNPSPAEQSKETFQLDVQEEMEKGIRDIECYSTKSSLNRASSLFKTLEETTALWRD